MMPDVDKIVRGIADGSTTAVAVLEATQERIAARDGTLNCFTELTMVRALGEARAIDALRAAGKPLPPLAGVPYAVKNLFDIAGVTTLSGGKVNADGAPARADAELIVRMQAAGAVLVGALNMDEHAYGFSTENTHYGPTRNPHDLARIAGGSSGGCAAAVAGELVPLTLGSDTNGSIRVPSSLCGIFGLKPTYGRLPRTGSFPFVHSLDHLGPFASSVAGLAAAYDAMQGPDSRDHGCAPHAAQPTATLLGLTLDAMPGADSPATRPLRVAVLGGWFDEWAGDAARNAVAQAASALGASGTVVLRGAELARSAAFIITGSEGGALHRQRLRTRYDEYEPLSRDRLVAGSLLPAAWLAQAQRIRQQMYLEALALFADWDVLIAPSTPVAAPLIGSAEIDIGGRTLPMRASMGLLTQPISCIGLPVCAAPIRAAAVNGLPLGVQLIAAPWREDLCLAAALALERAGVAVVIPPRAFS